MAEKSMSLLAAVRRGEEGALEQLAELLYPRVRGFVHRELAQDFRKSHPWILGAFSTGDLVHEVFLKLLRDLDQFQGEDAAALFSYVARTTHHRVIDFLKFHLADRRNANRRDAEGQAKAECLSADQSTPATRASAREIMAVFEEVLGTLDERAQQLIRLRTMEDLPFADIAETLRFNSANSACRAHQQALAQLLVRLRSRGIGGTGASR